MMLQSVMERRAEDEAGVDRFFGHVGDVFQDESPAARSVEGDRRVAQIVPAAGQCHRHHDPPAGTVALSSSITWLACLMDRSAGWLTPIRFCKKSIKLIFCRWAIAEIALSCDAVAGRGLSGAPEAAWPLPFV